jgi:hypothetical protein
MMSSFLSSAWNVAGAVWTAVWPVLLFFVLFSIVKSLWLYWRNRIFEQSLTFKFLELKMPREITRSPRSMDQFFHAVAGMRNVRGHLGEKYLLGEVTIWFTMEIVSLGGEIHFYARVFDQYVPIFKAALFAAYPEIEVVDAEDYVSKWVPHSVLDMELEGKDLYANEFLLKKSPAYPIKTYMQFESNTEEYQVDPMAVFLEAMATVRPDEFIGLQFNFAPEDPGWGNDPEYQKVVEDLRTPKAATHQPPPAGGIDIEALRQVTLQKSPGQTKILEAVERNLTKPAFAVNIRLLYVAPRKTFSDRTPRRAMRGAFNQYNATDLNILVFNERMNTKPGWFDPPFVFKRTRRRARKHRVLHLWHEREIGIHERMGKFLSDHIFNWFGSRTDILSTESMATLYHPPTTLVVTGPLTQRVESRKMGAPAGLPIYADESVLDKFK